MLTFALLLELVHIRLPIQALVRRGEIELYRLTTTRASSVRPGHRICCPEDLPITRIRRQVGSLHQRRPVSDICLLARSRLQRRQVSPQSNRKLFLPLYRASSLHRGRRIYRPAAHASSTTSKCTGSLHSKRTGYLWHAVDSVFLDKRVRFIAYLKIDYVILFTVLFIIYFV
jgi:hypothetical protein